MARIIDDSPPHVQWGMAIKWSDQPSIHQLNGRLMLRTASVAKVFLLVRCAEAISDGAIDPNERLSRLTVPPVHDSGVWQFLSVNELPIIDVARLIGAYSDNWATNVLLLRLGLESVQECARSLTRDGSNLWDFIRDLRRPVDPPSLSSGTACDWLHVFASLYDQSLARPDVCDLVLDWLRSGADLSMVASGFYLDPLSHGTKRDRGLKIWNKTGTDEGVRADIGIVERHGRSGVYAVICNWDASSGDERDGVMDHMRRFGDEIVRHLYWSTYEGSA